MNNKSNLNSDNFSSDLKRSGVKQSDIDFVQQKLPYLTEAEINKSIFNGEFANFLSLARATQGQENMAEFVQEALLQKSELLLKADEVLNKIGDLRVTLKNSHLSQEEKGIIKTQLKSLKGEYIEISKKLGKKIKIFNNVTELKQDLQEDIKKLQSEKEALESVDPNRINYHQIQRIYRLVCDNYNKQLNLLQKCEEAEKEGISLKQMTKSYKGGRLVMPFIQYDSDSDEEEVGAKKTNIDCKCTLF
jgi:hypothetical protein